MTHNNKLSLYALTACMSVVLYGCFFVFPKWKNTDSEATIGWDVTGYYWYLPSAFIYKDLKHQSFADGIIAKYHPTPSFIQANVAPNGNRVIMYSSGMAWMYLPAFTIAHVSAKALGYAADGFSYPYQFTLSMEGLLVALIGIWYFRKLMLLYFSDTVTAIMLLLLVFGTNYLDYSAIDNVQTHNFLFTGYVLLLLNTHYFYTSSRYKYAWRIGVLCGLMILIRPSEMICPLIPLLWGMESFSKEAIRRQFLFLRGNAAMLFVAVVCVVLIGSVQMAYWYYVTGHPLYYSYGDQSFNWLTPQFKKYLFDYGVGWIVYTPVALFCFIGVIPFLKQGRNRVAILGFFALNFYIVCSWQIWWYGSRAMVQSLPIMSFPLAALVQYTIQRKCLFRAFAVVLLLCVYINIWAVWNLHRPPGLIVSGAVTEKYYWHILGRWTPASEEVQKLMDNDELFEGKPVNIRSLYANGFETDSLYNIAYPALTGHRSLFIKKHSKGPEYNFAFTGNGSTGIRVQARFHCINKEWNHWGMAQMIVKFKYKDSIIKENMVRLHRFLSNGQTRVLFLNDKIPPQPFDRVSISFLNEGDGELVADDLEAYSFDEQK